MPPEGFISDSDLDFSIHLDPRSQQALNDNYVVYYRLTFTI